MVEIRPLDEILAHPLLVHTGTDEEFQRALTTGINDEESLLFHLYTSIPYGIKFMLFENEGKVYVRLDRHLRGASDHHWIVLRFSELELRQHGIDPSTYHPEGGGRVFAKREQDKTTLTFHNASFQYNKFDGNLLKKTLEEHLDKRIGYKIE